MARSEQTDDYILKVSGHVILVFFYFDQ